VGGDRRGEDQAVRFPGVRSRTGAGGHCIPIDPFYLTWLARRQGLTTRFRDDDPFVPLIGFPVGSLQRHGRIAWTDGIRQPRHHECEQQTESGERPSGRGASKSRNHHNPPVQTTSLSEHSHHTWHRPRRDELLDQFQNRPPVLSSSSPPGRGENRSDVPLDKAESGAFVPIEPN
jgi:hypothetical protein